MYTDMQPTIGIRESRVRLPQEEKMTRPWAPPKTSEDPSSSVNRHVPRGMEGGGYISVHIFKLKDTLETSCRRVMSHCSRTTPFVHRKKHGTVANNCLWIQEKTRATWILFCMNIATPRCCSRVQEHAYACIGTLSHDKALKSAEDHPLDAWNYIRIFCFYSLI